MSDDIRDNNSGIGKPERVYLYEAYEVMYWTKKFGITVDKLKKAVKSVGHRPNDVEKYLRNENTCDNDI